MNWSRVILVAVLSLTPIVAWAQQPIPIIHPNPSGGGGGGGGSVVTDNVTIKGNGASAGNPIAIKSVQVDGASVTGTGAVGSPLASQSGIGGGVASVPGKDKWFSVINYGAKGDGVNDDYPASQAAIDAACDWAYASSGGFNANPHGTVYFPANPGISGSNTPAYLLSQPLRLRCSNIRISGAGRLSTRLRPNFDGPVLIIIAPVFSNGALSNNSFPILANDPAWVANHAYKQNDEIKDTNGNIEVVTTPGTSAGSQPSWPTSQGTTTVDNGVTWTLEVIGTQLATGTGSAADIQPSNPGETTVYLDLLDNWAMRTAVMQAITAVTVEGYFLVPAHGANNATLLTSFLSNPSSSHSTAADSISLKVAATTNQLQAQLKLTGGTVLVNSGATAFSSDTIHHVALVYDGASTVTLFLDGTNVGSSAGSGTLSWPSFEAWSLGGPWPDPQTWPDQSYLQVNPTWGAIIDSLRISNVARYSSNFTKPTAKFSTDANTLGLLNFPTNATEGTQLELTGSTPVNVYIAARWGGPAGHLTNVEIGDMQVCPGSGPAGGSDGIFAVFTAGSYFHDIQCDFPHHYGINAWFGDFNTYFARINIGGGGTAAGGVDFETGQSNNDDAASQIGVAGNTIGILQNGGAMTYNYPEYSLSTGTVFPYVCTGEGFGAVNDPVEDIEGGAPSILADMYISGCPWRINGGTFVITPGNTVPTPNVMIEAVGGAADNAPTFHNALFQNVTPGPIITVVDPANIASIKTPVEVSGAATIYELAANQNYCTGNGAPLACCTGVHQGSCPWLTDQPQLMITPDSCNGLVTLSNGAATFSNPCIQAQDVCRAVDVTNAVNSCVPHAPATSSISITGVGSDQCKVTCS